MRSKRITIHKSRRQYRQIVIAIIVLAITGLSCTVLFAMNMSENTNNTINKMQKDVISKNSNNNDINIKDEDAVDKSSNKNKRNVTISTENENIHLVFIKILSILNEQIPGIKKHRLFDNIKAISPILLNIKKIDNVSSNKKQEKPINNGSKPSDKSWDKKTKAQSGSVGPNATPVFKLTNDERDLLERLVMAEAGGESYIGQLAVINVVLNRLKSNDFPDTIRGVIFQDGQFTPVERGTIWRMKPTDSVKRAVRDAINGKRAVDKDTLYFFNPKSATNQWIPQNRRFAIKIGNHSFYK